MNPSEGLLVARHLYPDRIDGVRGKDAYVGDDEAVVTQDDDGVGVGDEYDAVGDDAFRHPWLLLAADNLFGLQGREAYGVGVDYEVVVEGVVVCGGEGDGILLLAEAYGIGGGECEAGIGRGEGIMHPAPVVVAGGEACEKCKHGDDDVK